MRRIFAPGALYKAALVEDLNDLQELLEEFPEAGHGSSSQRLKGHETIK